MFSHVRPPPYVPSSSKSTPRPSELALFFPPSRLLLLRTSSFPPSLNQPRHCSRNTTPAASLLLVSIQCLHVILRLLRIADCKYGTSLHLCLHPTPTGKAAICVDCFVVIDPEVAMRADTDTDTRAVAIEDSYLTLPSVQQQRREYLLTTDKLQSRQPLNTVGLQVHT